LLPFDILARLSSNQGFFFGSHAHLTDAKAFAAFLAPLSKKRWFVYAKRPFAGPKAVLAYLSPTRTASPSRTAVWSQSTSAASHSRSRITGSKASAGIRR
jgi:Putative transposase